MFHFYLLRMEGLTTIILKTQISDAIIEKSVCFASYTRKYSKHLRAHGIFVLLKQDWMIAFF